MSPSLADKLKSLGVKVGAEGLRPQVEIPRKGARQPLEASLGGRWLESRRGPAFVVEKIYPLDYAHGDLPIRLSAPLGGMPIGQRPAPGRAGSRTTGLPRHRNQRLSGGTGTYAFMVGVARYIGENLHLAMFFMPAPRKKPPCSKPWPITWLPAPRWSPLTANPSMRRCSRPVTACTAFPARLTILPTSTCCPWPAVCGVTACPRAH
jgi:hypothetical protein